jgi:hypothetical protein
MAPFCKVGDCLEDKLHYSPRSLFRVTVPLVISGNYELHPPFTAGGHVYEVIVVGGAGEATPLAYERRLLKPIDWQ